jgi:hypothetical protein
LGGDNKVDPEGIVFLSPMEMRRREHFEHDAEAPVDPK